MATNETKNLPATFSTSVLPKKHMFPVLQANMSSALRLSDFSHPQVELPSAIGLAPPMGLISLPRKFESFFPAVKSKTFDELLFDANASCKIATSLVAMHLRQEWKSNIFHQLDDLHDPEGWYGEDKPTELSSFKTFLRLILHVKPLKKPGLGLSSAGEIVASWMAGPKEPLTIVCKANDEVSWSLIHIINDEESESAAGRLKLQRLMASLQPYEPQRWLF